MREQGIPAELDDDGLDRDAVHVLVLHGSRAVATGRLTISGCAGTLARIAVERAFRGRGLGQRVVRALEHEALARGVERLVLHPHAELEGFYGTLGYRKVPGESVAGPHRLIVMEKRVDP